jgi:hypothetical protein
LEKRNKKGGKLIMETLSFIVLILLSLVGYSAGAVSKAGKFAALKPQIIDLILVVIIWIGAITSRVIFGLNKWLLILIWVILGFIIGILAVWPRRLSEEKAPSTKRLKGTSKNPLKKLWSSWKSFSKRMGSFQTRIIFSFFYFIFVTPFALGVKIFSDPLKIKHKSSKSHWLPKKEIKYDLEQYRRQF